MTKYWKRSRITKAFADSSRVRSFAEAEARLDSIRLEIVVGDDQIRTPAGQAAALTAVATAKKCFGSITIVASKDAALVAELPIGKSVLMAARRLGARRADAQSPRATHRVCIGDVPGTAVWSVACWWNRWLAGTRAFVDDAVGDSRLALAGTFAGALAVRQIFACAAAGRNVLPRDETVSVVVALDGGQGRRNRPRAFRRAGQALAARARAPRSGLRVESLSARRLRREACGAAG